MTPSPVGLDDRAGALRAHALELGFDLCGIAPAGPFPESDAFDRWLADGYAGEMHYMKKYGSARGSVSRMFPDVRSVVVCGLNYNTSSPRTTHDPRRAWVSRYAWGTDYHELVGQKLKALAQWMERNLGSDAKAYVDTGPLLERVYARYAGIGWFGKNTCIINQGIGSWLFLGCVLTNQQLDVSSPPPDRCGTCTRCIEACPTNALVAPYVLDSRKCISYTTIELRGAIPVEDREGIGHHLFGCDICQDVCPWNRKAPADAHPELQARSELFWPDLAGLLALDDEGWRQRIRGTPLKRARVHGLIRNALIVAGNSGQTSLTGVVQRFLSHPDPVVQDAAAWALRRLASSGQSAPDVPATESESA